VFLSMQQSEPDVQSLEERIALLERESNLKRQAFEYLTQLHLKRKAFEYLTQLHLKRKAFEYLTQLRLTSLTPEDEVGDGGALAEWKSDCEAVDGKLSDDKFDPSASEYDQDEFDDDSIPSSAPAEQKPVFRHKPKFRLPDYDTQVARPPHYKKLYAPMLEAGGSAPPQERGL
jgi:hypothetical protein